MKVKLKRGWSKSYPELTVGNVYRVLGIEAGSFFDYDMHVRQRLHSYVHQKCHQDSETLPDPPNSYVRVEWKHESPDDPITLYSELDEERWEVRKIEVFRDGRIASADGKGATGTAELGDQPVPAIEEIASNPELAVTQIGREEFEEIWNKALDAACS